MLKYMLIFPAVFLSCGLSYAQHDPEAKKVFENNYANEILGKSASPDSGRAAVSRGKKVEVKKGKTESGVEPDKSGDFGFINPKELAEPTKKPIENYSYEDREGTKIIWVGAVLSSSNSDHIVEKLDELAEEAVKFDLMLGPIFLVGNTDVEAISRHVLKLEKRQAIITYRHEVPAKYSAVKLSPTWIMQTAKGQILLEGLGPLKQNLNKNGELILPPQS
jgi:hypothetical protein